MAGRVQVNQVASSYLSAVRTFNDEMDAHTLSTLAENLDRMVAQYFQIREYYAGVQADLRSRNVGTREIQRAQGIQNEVEAKAARLFRTNRRRAPERAAPRHAAPQAAPRAGQRAGQRARADEIEAQRQIQVLYDLKGSLKDNRGVRESFEHFSKLNPQIQLRCYELLFRERIINVGIDKALRNPAALLPILREFRQLGRVDQRSALQAFNRLDADQQLLAYEKLCRADIINEGIDEFLRDPPALLKNIRANGRELPILDHLLLAAGAPAPREGNGPRHQARDEEREIQIEPARVPGAMPRLRVNLQAQGANNGPEEEQPEPGEAEPTAEELAGFSPENLPEIAEDDPEIPRDLALPAILNNFDPAMKSYIVKARAKCDSDTRDNLDIFLGGRPRGGMGMAGAPCVRDMQDYKNPLTKPKVEASLRRILDGIYRNEKYRAAVSALLTEASTSCGDRTAIYFGKLETYWFVHCDPRTRTLDGLAKILIGLNRMEIIEQQGRMIAAEVGNAHEELATILGLQVALREAFELPISTNGVLYQHCAHLTGDHIQRVRDILLTTNSAPDKANILIQNEAWCEKMKARIRGLNTLDENAEGILSGMMEAEEHAPDAAQGGKVENFNDIAMDIQRGREIAQKKLIFEATLEFLTNPPAQAPAQKAKPAPIQPKRVQSARAQPALVISQRRHPPTGPRAVPARPHGSIRAVPVGQPAPESIRPQGIARMIRPGQVVRLIFNG